MAGFASDRASRWRNSSDRLILPAVKIIWAVFVGDEVCLGNDPKDWVKVTGSSLVSESVVPESDRQQEEQGRGVPSGGEPRPRPASVPPGGFGLRFYKPGQGFSTRAGTAIGAGVLIIAGAIFLFNELDGLMDQRNPYRLPVQYGVVTCFMFLMGIVIYWLVGLNRKVNDFFIATEGEMKKVSWSTRKEVIRSTKVVIVSVVFLGIFLFMADLMFIVLFSAIKVLQWDVLERLFGKGS